MPIITLPTAVGSVPFHYKISTPTTTDADEIDPSLPTILLLHPSYFPSETMHPQFNDPQLRAVNLIAMDARGSGFSHPYIGPSYNQHEAADDIYQFVLALKLPSIFIAGLSCGTIAGFQFAISHPDRVRGVFLASHLCLAEIEDVVEGRQEIFELWMEGVRTNDQELVEECISGSHQLAYNNIYTNFTTSLLQVSIDRATLPEREEHREQQDKLLLVDYFTNRTPYTREQLIIFAAYSVPVCLLAGEEDVAYPVSYTEEFWRNLNAAGVRAEMHVVAGGPHYLTITHPVQVNALLRQFVFDNLPAGTPVPPTPDASTIESPFLKMLVNAGMVPGHEYEPEEKALKER